MSKSPHTVVSTEGNEKLSKIIEGIIVKRGKAEENRQRPMQDRVSNTKQVFQHTVVLLSESENLHLH